MTDSDKDGPVAPQGALGYPYRDRIKAFPSTSSGSHRYTDRCDALSSTNDLSC